LGTSPHNIPVTFRIDPQALDAMLRLWQQDREKVESESLRCYLGEVLLRCVKIITTPAGQRTRQDERFLAEIGREFRAAVSITTEDGEEICFRFL